MRQSVPGFIPWEQGGDGIAVADARCESWLLELYELHPDEDSDPVQVNFSTENVQVAARCLYREKKLPYLEFQYGQEHMWPDQDGRMHSWPNGWCDHWDRWLFRLVGGEILTDEQIDKLNRGKRPL